ncbi:MAG: hypothetical protein ACK4PR_10430, partial [Gammaproteobacteria bacterium]
MMKSIVYKSYTLLRLNIMGRELKPLVDIKGEQFIGNMLEKAKAHVNLIETFTTGFMLSANQTVLEKLLTSDNNQHKAVLITLGQSLHDAAQENPELKKAISAACS